MLPMIRVNQIPIQPQLTPLQKLLKHVYGRTKLIDSKASISDYLFSLPSKQSSVIAMREKIFSFLMDPNCTEDVYAFKNSPVAILRDARQLADANNLKKCFTYKFSALGPNPNGQHTVTAKKHTQPVINYNAMAVLSSVSICRHFFDIDLFHQNLGSLPLLLNFFERGSIMQDVNNELFSSPKVMTVAPEFLLWATTGGGVNSVRRSYEVLETYGDTVLKLAATLIAYCIKKGDRKAGEGDIENSKVIYVTNFHVFRVGFHVLKMHRFMRMMRDPEAKEWQLPLQGV